MIALETREAWLRSQTTNPILPRWTSETAMLWCAAEALERSANAVHARSPVIAANLAQ